jgi:cytochrome P450
MNRLDPAMLPLPPAPSSKTGIQALKIILNERSLLPALAMFHHEIGDIFHISLPGFQPVVLVGPEANHFLLVESRDDVRWRPECDPVARLLKQGVLVVDGEFHDNLRRQINPMLHKRKLGNYIDIMLCRTDQILDCWKDGAVYDMLSEMRKIALLILMDSLFNEDFSIELNTLWKSILKTLVYISPGAWLLWPGIPRPGFQRALQEMDRYLYQVIQYRRDQPWQQDDLIGSFFRNPEMSDDLIRDQLLTLLIAGHDTSTALLAWSLYLLGKYPEAMERAYEEVDTVLTGRAPNMENASQLIYLDQVVKETLRLYPPIHIGMRIAAKDLGFQGYRIPSGSRVVYSIYLTHRMEKYWPDPERFDPERFTPDRTHDRPPYTYVPFGGGPRNCIGMAFALTEVKIVLARILQRFKLSMGRQVVHPHMGATLEPRPGVFIKVISIKKK